LITRIRGVSEETKTLLSLESITDVFTVALAILLMRVMLLQTADLTASLVNIFNNAINGLFFGVVGGLLFIGIFRRISGEEFPYGVMLSIIFLFYSITEFAGGSGALAVFVMGIILANRKQITSVFRTTEVGSIPSMKIGEFILDMELTKTHAMISFFVRTFFFVYIGAIVAIDNVQGFMVGTLISLGLLTARVVFIAIVTYNRRISGFDRKIMTVMLPRGLSAAVLALLPYSMGIPDTEVFSDIVFTVILGTACIASIGTTIIKKF
jgi:cell volume regulation protein A